MDPLLSKRDAPSVDEFGIPFDDEPITPEEAEALRAFAAGEGEFVSHEEACREMGIEP